jgi:hypothetical protein
MYRAANISGDQPGPDRPPAPPRELSSLVYQPDEEEPLLLLLPGPVPQTVICRRLPPRSIPQGRVRVECQISPGIRCSENRSGSTRYSRHAGALSGELSNEFPRGATTNGFARGTRAHREAALRPGPTFKISCPSPEGKSANNFLPQFTQRPPGRQHFSAQ